MNEFISKVIDGVHRLLDPRLSATILLASLALIYGPDLLARPRTRWPDAEGYFIGAAVLSGASLLVWLLIGAGKAVSTAAGWSKDRVVEAAHRRVVEDTLKSLSPRQRVLLAVFVAGAFPENRHLPHNNPLVTSMRDNGALRCREYDRYSADDGTLMTCHLVADKFREHLRGREGEFLSGHSEEDQETVVREIFPHAQTGRYRRI